MLKTYMITVVPRNCQTGEGRFAAEQWSSNETSKIKAINGTWRSQSKYDL